MTTDQETEAKEPGEPTEGQIKEREEAEEKEAIERKAPGGAVVHRAILEEGEEELRRPTSALAWSGLAAGLSMGFSFITEGLLQSYLPDAPWRPLVAKLGYSVGFLIVILGRQQLFTENTLTVMLPLLERMSLKTLLNVLRLWVVVLAANLVGAAAVALVVAHTNLFDKPVHAAMLELARTAMEPGAATVLLRGIFAGWLIALMIWLLPFAESARVVVIIIITYVVGLGHLSHVIAGAVEVLYLPAAGMGSWGAAIGGYILPALGGNIIGGVMLVAMVNHAQVVAGKNVQDVYSRQ
jgi:formate-nitrite transporter family protein